MSAFATTPSDPTPARSRENILVNRLRLKQLALLAALAQTNNLHRAAAMLNITQPTATKMLTMLEQGFDAALFERLPRGLRPTDLGADAIALAGQLLGDIRRFCEALELKQRGGDGRLAVGAIMGALPDVVTQAVVTLKRRRPLLQLRLMGETSDALAAMLERDEIDLAIGRFDNLLPQGHFHFAALAQERLIAVARRGHRLARRKQLTLAQLQTCQWVLQPPASPLRQMLEQEFVAARLAMPLDTVECNSIFGTLQLLRAGDAVAVLSEPVVREQLHQGLLVALALPLASTLTRALPGFGILTRKDLPLSPVAQEFVQTLLGASAAASFNAGKAAPAGRPG